MRRGGGRPAAPIAQGSTSSRSTAAATSRAMSMKARAAGERWRSRCQTTATTRRGTFGTSRIALTRSSPGAIASRGVSATPKPAATSPWIVPLSSERKPYSILVAAHAELVLDDEAARARVRPDQDVVAEVVERGRRALGERAVGRDEEDVRVAHQVERLEGAVRQRRAAEGEVDARPTRSPRRAPGRSSAPRARARCRASRRGSGA